MRVHVAELFVYPVKSLAAVSLEAMALRDTGPAEDRQWMIVDATGRFVSQRQLPQLARIRADIATGQLQLCSADGHRIEVPQPSHRDVIEVRVWGDHCLGLVASMEVNRWLTVRAGSKAPLRLVKFEPSRTRTLARDRFGAGKTWFADAAPYLITTTASLQALNAHLASAGHATLEMTRFRPNIVLEGPPPFAEHSAHTLANETFALQLVDHCQRCSVVMVNPTTGIRDAHPQLLLDIAKVNGMPGQLQAAAFGVNSMLRKGCGEIVRRGEPLTLTSLGH